jgi:RNA polymerase sigma-70 factor (ECF subfamily)
MDHLTNEELLARYQAADPDAFEAFFERNRRLVFQYLYSRLGTVQDAEEAFQKTFFKIHRYIGKYDPSQSALGWVMTIARNVAFDLYPKRAAAESLENVPAEQLAKSDESVEARDALVALLEQLDPRERRLIERRFLHEESFEAIAKDEGWSVQNARQRTSRLVRKLRSLHFA